MFRAWHWEGRSLTAKGPSNDRAADAEMHQECILNVGWILGRVCIRERAQFRAHPQRGNVNRSLTSDPRYRLWFEQGVPEKCSVGEFFACDRATWPIPLVAV